MITRARAYRRSGIESNYILFLHHRSRLSPRILQSAGQAGSASPYEVRSPTVTSPTSAALDGGHGAVDVSEEVGGRDMIEPMSPGAESAAANDERNDTAGTEVVAEESLPRGHNINEAAGFVLSENGDGDHDDNDDDEDNDDDDDFTDDLDAIMGLVNGESPRASLPHDARSEDETADGANVAQQGGDEGEHEGEAVDGRGRTKSAGAGHADGMGAEDEARAAVDPGSGTRRAAGANGSKRAVLGSIDTMEALGGGSLQPFDFSSDDEDGSDDGLVERFESFRDRRSLHSRSVPDASDSSNGSARRAVEKCP